MTNFNDIQFKEHPAGGVQGRLDIKDVMLSVVAGKFLYSSPRESLTNPDDFTMFEVAIMNKQGFCTKDFVTNADDDVLGWQTRDDINAIIELILKK